MAIIDYREADETFFLRYDHPEPEEVVAAAVNHRRHCPIGKSGWPDTSRQTLHSECVRRGCQIGYKLITHRGRVLSTRERNGYDDSDFYATVWTGKGTQEIMYATTRGWTYFNGALVDATDEVLAAYGAWKARRQRAAELAATQKAGKLAAIRSGMPAFGERWRVKSKRSKLAHGTEVEIASDPVMSSYADPMMESRYPLPAETLEERFHRRPGDLTVQVRTLEGRQTWVSCSVLERT